MDRMSESSGIRSRWSDSIFLKRAEAPRSCSRRRPIVLLRGTNTRENVIVPAANEALHLRATLEKITETMIGAYYKSEL